MKRFLGWVFLPLLLGTLLFGAPIVSAPAPVLAVTDPICDPNGDGNTDDAIDKAACAISGKAEAQSAVARVLSNIVQVLVFIVGGISVIVVVVGGLMYVLSGGDPNNTRRAKDAIMFALIGLLVALIAQGLVSFVLRKI